MSSVQWHWISPGKAACAARLQNLSRAVQELRWQGADTKGRQLRYKKVAAEPEKSTTGLFTLGTIHNQRSIRLRRVKKGLRACFDIAARRGARQRRQRSGIDRGRLPDGSMLMYFFGPTEDISRAVPSPIRPTRRFCRIFCSLGPIKTQRCANGRRVSLSGCCDRPGYPQDHPEFGWIISPDYAAALAQSASPPPGSRARAR
jgi:hypothetical protein